MEKLHTTPSTYFVKSARNLAETLFHPTGTAMGTYKKRKRSILFYKPCGELFACLVANRHDERFFVTCCHNEGKIFYMFGLQEQAAAHLGLAEMSYRKRNETACEVWDSITTAAA